jgi:uncharacterized protein
MHLRFEWDEAKNRRNRLKHRISFETAKSVFDDPSHVSLLERIDEAEERWQTLGTVEGAVVVLVVHTYREADGAEVVRIRSARKATPTERRWYEKSGPQ